MIFQPSKTEESAMKKSILLLVVGGFLATYASAGSAQQQDLNAKLRAQTGVPIQGQTRAAVRAQGIRGQADLQQPGATPAQVQQGQGQVVDNQGGVQVAPVQPTYGNTGGQTWNWTPGTFGPNQYNPAGPNAALRSSYFGSLRYNQQYFRNGYNPNAYNPNGYNPYGYNPNNGIYNNGYNQEGMVYRNGYAPGTPATMAPNPSGNPSAATANGGGNRVAPNPSGNPSAATANPVGTGAAGAAVPGGGGIPGGIGAVPGR